mmetsp:Transcript_42166/g.67302  ORF Transcript_42166/g.67302 Transcript_42166/m.67302 type:complete len:83 (+) Transcript_42166:3-251(+)
MALEQNIAIMHIRKTLPASGAPAPKKKLMRTLAQTVPGHCIFSCQKEKSVRQLRDIPAKLDDVAVESACKLLLVKSTSRSID